MDTKMQSPPTPHPHSSSQPQDHTCNQCNCRCHCRICNQASRPSTSSSPNSSPPLRHPKQTMHSRYSPQRPSHLGSSPKNRKTLEGKVHKRRGVQRRKKTHGAKRRSSGRRHN